MIKLIKSLFSSRKREEYTSVVNKHDYLESLIQELEKEIDIYLCGYNKRLNNSEDYWTILLPLKILFPFIEKYSKDVLNIHPAKLLKRFGIAKSDYVWGKFRDGVMHYNELLPSKKYNVSFTGLDNYYQDEKQSKLGNPVWGKSKYGYWELDISQLLYLFKTEVQKELKRTNIQDTVTLQRSYKF